MSICPFCEAEHQVYQQAACEECDRQFLLEVVRRIWRKQPNTKSRREWQRMAWESYSFTRWDIDPDYPRSIAGIWRRGWGDGDFEAICIAVCMTVAVLWRALATPTTAPQGER